MDVAKLQGETMQDVYLETLNTRVNIVRDIHDNFVVCIEVGEALQAEYNVTFTPIKWEPKPEE